MTGRERLLAAYTRQPKDRVPWVPIIWSDTMARYPEEERAAGPIAFTRSLGADILWRWGGYLAAECDVECREWREGNTTFHEWHTPYGNLREAVRAGRHVEHRLKSPDDLRAYRHILEHTTYRPACDSHAPTLAEVGDAGIVAAHVGPSAVQELLQISAGVDGFAYLCADAPAELDAVIACQHERDLQRYRIAAQSPAEVLILVENTSTMMLSPVLYRRWSRQHVADFCRIAHEHGKVAMVHMCGHVRDLLPDIAETGLGGIDCLTPAPTGNTSAEDAWAAIGPELIVHAILDPTAWIHRQPVEIAAAMARALPPGMRERNFLLCTAGDGLPDIPRAAWDVLAEAWERYSAR